MAASPRPMPDDAPPPRRAPGTVVPLRPGQHRSPPPSVVRRRRLLALVAVIALFAVPAVAAVVLTGGGSTSATSRITALLQRGTSEPATLCSHLSPAMSSAIGGPAACVKASPQKRPAGAVRDVRVHGTTATATVSGAGSDEHVRLVRQDGDWKIDDVR